MRKRLALVICLLLVSLFGFMGCKDDPYASMTLSIEGASTESVQQLLIEREVQGTGEIGYTYPTIEFTVKVENYGDADPNIKVSGWEGYINEPKVTYLGNGVSQVSSQVVSYDSTGRFTLSIVTNEGNKATSLQYEVDLKLDSFEINADKLQAVSTSYEICLDTIGGLITYYPENSTQKDITYTVAIPTTPYGDGYSIDGKWADEDAVYFMDQDLLNYLAAGYKYAEVKKDKDTGKQTLYVYPYFLDATGALALDTEGNPIPSIYPSIYEETVGEGTSVELDMITLKATSEALSIPEFIDIEVVESAGTAVLEMNAQMTETPISINRDKNNEFNVVLVDPDFKGGVVSAGAMSYYTERDLLFYVEGIVGGADNVLEEYYVIADNVSANDEQAVDISMIGDANQFKIHALSEGKYTHKFKVSHSKYPGLFDEEIVVNFKVIKMPFNIDVNGYDLEIGSNQTILTSVYNVYPRTSYGTKLKVNTLSQFDYFLYLEAEDTNYKSMVDNLTVRRDGDGEKAVFASMAGVDSGMSSLGSTVEGVPFTTFKSSSTFFLSHSFAELPTEYLAIYIGISFAVSDESYTEEVAANFLDLTLIYPIMLNIENGIDKIAYEQDAYYVNLSNDVLEYAEEDDGTVKNYDSGMKLWQLPAGKNIENSVKSIVYDEDLIKVYPFYDESSQITTLYIKYVKDAGVGETEIVIETLNQLVKSVKVYTFVPTIYQYNGDLTDTSAKMPLSISVDMDSSAFLYYMSGRADNDAFAQWQLYSSEEVAIDKYYDSVKRLFMITNATQKITVYDYQVKNVAGRTVVTPIDVTNKISVTFSYPNYAKYANGIITTNSLITYNIDAPIVMTITYTAGYECEDISDGRLVYGTYTMKHTIDLFIYERLQGVEVLTAKAVDLYVEDSLGYYDKALSSHTIVSTYIPNEVKLGAEWNNSPIFKVLDTDEDGGMQPVKLWYDCDMVYSNIVGDNGEEIKVKSLVSGEYRIIKYSDLFAEPNIDEENYVLTVTSIISDDLLEWFGDNGYGNADEIETILQEHIFTNNIHFVVNVYITQFKRLQNVNQIKFTAKYASKTTGLKLDVEDDGVYFEVRKNTLGDWELSKESIIVPYTINNPGSVGSEVILSNEETLFYSAKVVADSTGTGGQIVITPKLSKGVGYLVVTTRDNIVSIDGNNNVDYYNDNSVLSFRVKVADGSKGFEFEITSADDYQRLYATTSAGYYYQYIITRDINLKGYNVSGLNILNTTQINLNNAEFCLSGKHTYFKNGIEITKFNSIYNLEINANVNYAEGSLINIGLFGEISDCVTLDNVFIKNSTIRVEEDSENDGDYSVGLLVGKSTGAIINACSVSGNIKIIRNTDSSSAYIGGVAGTVQNGGISSLPGNYETGIVSTGNNAYVDIEITYGNEDFINSASLTATKTVAGGLVGLANNAVINKQQVVSNITTTIRSVIGGVVGLVNAGTGSTNRSSITAVDVSPRLIANVTSTANETNTGLYAGSIIGLASTSYTVVNSIVNYVDIGDDEEYAWQDRVNTLIYAFNEKVAVGGIIGGDANNTTQKSSIQTTYVRSYYRRVIDENYAGNIYVIAGGESSVGGLIGLASSFKTTIYKAYFDANLSVHTGVKNVGMLLGSIPSVVGLELRYSYAIGLNYNISFVDADGDTVADVDNSGNLITVLAPVSDIKKLAIGTVGSSWTTGSIPVINSYENTQTLTLSALGMTNVYVVANEKETLFGEGNLLYYIDSLSSMLSVSGGQSTIFGFLTNQLSYSITNGENEPLSDVNWFWHSEVNTSTVGSAIYAFPVLVNGNLIMYDLVPTKIDVLFNERTGLYNINYTEGEVTTQQVIMYINRDSNGQIADDCYYEMSLDNESSEFVISLKGSVNVSTTYVNVNNLKVNDKIEFIESSDGTIIEIVGNRIYPVSTGTVTLTIRSYVAKSIKATITIVVVDGITNFEFIYDETKELENVQYTIQGDKIITDNVVYVDELTEFNLYTYNQIKGNNYVANSNIGFILEILDASGTDENGVTIENGIIKINGTEFTYNSTSPLDNIYVFNVRTFKVSGVYIGNVKFVITPYINLNSVTYVDSYRSVGLDDEGNSQVKALNNAYILDGEAVSTSNLQKTYELGVRARAKGVTTSVKNVEIDASNIVSFNVIIETANVKIYDNGNNTYSVVILEDLYIQINNKKFNAPLILTESTFTCEYTNGKYVCTDFSSLVSGAFDYTLINILFNSLSLTKTNVDTISRNNTYKITLGATISFDRDFYRANANSYDLNTILYNVSFVPTSNPSVVTSTQLIASIVPSEINTIFTNFYSKGVDKTNNLYDEDQETEYEYPEYNDSSFIVPGRDGLLKITTDEEFNNSSYMTVTLSKEYLGYVTLQQLAGMVTSESDISVEGSVPEIVGYKYVTSLEYFETANTFGIKLSKLSLNYMDNHYFNNTYFVKVLAVKDIVQSNVVMQIASYKVDRDNNKTLQLTKEVSLQVMELPQIKVTVGGDDYAVMGKGVVKELEVYYKGLTNDINFLSPSEDTETTLNVDPTIDYMYIADDEGNRVVGKLSLEYLDSGRKYYLYQDVVTMSGSTWSIEFNAQQTILGAIEESKCSLIIDTVDFEIDKIEVCGTATNELNLLHGQTTVLETKFKIKDIVVGDKAEIETYKKKLLEEKGAVTINQYAFAGTYFSEGTEVYSSDKSYIQERTFEGSDTIYTDIYVAKEQTKRVGSVTFSRREQKDDDLHYLYYEISGTGIGDDTYIRLDVDYYFDTNGKMQVGNDVDNKYIYNYTIDIHIIVSDNSTYDHPTPIETQDDLYRACGVEGGNFILINNISLVNWQPQEALFDTLDGNGYIITIESLDLSSVWGEKSADVGIFSTVSEDSMLKNITVDVSSLLKTETQMTNDIALMRASAESTYAHSTDNIDLGYIPELNFGILAGVNNGAITNAKIISTSKSNGSDRDRLYLHILTTLGYMDNSLVVSNIGGLVGQNSSTGAISNSFVGISINGDYIEGVRSASSAELDNSTDNLEDIRIYPFVLAGGNNIAGMASINDGIISNSYTKGLGVYNTFPTVGESATAGLVVTNNNLISSAFVEGNEIEGYRAVQNKFMLESTGYIGGLVYENNAKIENSYTNAYLQTLSSFLGGFVYINNKDAVIKNAYSTAVNKNSLATGQFTGVKQGVVQNFGTYENCYYLVEYSKYENINEQAQAIVEKQDDGSVMNPYDEMGSWSGFSFVTGVNVDGIWSVAEGQTPRIETTLTDTVSFRKLINTEFNEADGGTVYNYAYNTYYLGTKANPLLIDKAENFDKYIIDSSFDNGSGNKILGNNTSEYLVRYVRVVNNLNFESITTAKEYDGTYLYKVIFAGVLDGNGMTLSNLNINTDTTGLNNFGLFAQIGLEDLATKSVVKNFTMNLRTYKSTGNSSAGVLAGTIVNSSIVNVKINGNGQTVSAINTAGALAGAIYSTNDVSISLIDIDIENIKVEATYSSLGGTLNSRSEDKGYYFKQLTVESEGTQSSYGHTFKSLYNSANKTTSITLADRKTVSYAGLVSGVVLANNSTKVLDVGNVIDDYRTKVEESTINNIVVSGNVSVGTADNAGGLFGYVGENTLVRNSKLVVSDNQLLKGFNNIGGIVGENHGIIELCSVAYDEEKQAEYDATLINNEVDNGTFNLFDMSTGEPYYVVSIGGIAGKSEDGVIIDSYTTVNVSKSLSYIAGGIVGYAEGYNYLGYVYNTGTVLGLYVVGGIVGFQVNDFVIADEVFTNQLVMKNVVSLTNWNASNEVINVRNTITSRLFENTKFMYTNSTQYFNYYFKMPEIGNAPINYITDDEDIEENYRTSHNNYYVGSVVGKTMFRFNESEIGNYLGSTKEVNSHIIYNNNLITDLYNNCSNVFSSTLGLMSSTGDVESSTRVDDYFKTSFVVEIGQDLDINSLSYRIAYRKSNDGNELNQYELIDSSAETSSSYVDKFDYNQVFTSQEYRQQLLGKSYSGVSFDENGDVVASKSTKNIFINGYNSNRNSASTEVDGGQFVDSKSLVWEMQNLESQGLNQGLRPIYANKVKVSREQISDESGLMSAFSNSASGKTYEIINDISIDVVNSTNDRFIEYFGSVKSVFIGAKPDGDRVTRPTITINMIDKNADGQTNNLATIFNLWSGATFDNIEFVINIDKSNFDILEVSRTNYGLLANTIDGAYILNCVFKIVVDNMFTIDAVGVGSVASEHAYYAENVGVLFGSIDNSEINNTQFEVTVNGINITNEKVTNFGLLAGRISGSSISGCTFAFNDIKINVAESASTLNIGSVAGSVLSSKISKNIQELSESYDNLIQVTDKYDNLIKNIGGMFGYSSAMNFAGFKAENESLSDTNHYLMKVGYLADTTLSLSELNMASLVAKASSTRIDNYIVIDNNDADGDSVYTISAKNNDKDIVVDSLSIGSMIGYDVSSSQLGRTGAVGNYVDIISTIPSYSANVGGLIGYTAGSNQLMSNAFYDGIMMVTNMQVGKSETKVVNDEDISVITYADTNVGGLVGLVDGYSVLTSVMSSANISVTTADNSTLYTNTSLGGLVGRADGNTKIDGFASIGLLSATKDTMNDINGYGYISGVIGYNNAIFTGSNGYSYIDLPDKVYAEVSAITNGIVSILNNSVFYAQEFIGNNYNNDYKFISYAMGDIYDTLSKYSALYVLNTADGLELDKIGSVELFVPTIAKGRISEETKVSFAKLKPSVVNGSTLNSQYNVIISDWSDVIDKIAPGYVVSGRTNAVGKVTLKVNALTNVKYIVTTNEGVLSNIYINAGESGVANKLAISNTNNGLITHCYVYGLSSNDYVFANDNNGKIYSCGSAIKYVSSGSTSQLFAFVNTNHGEIIDCYSSSFGYTESANYVTDVYMVNTNAGTIQNCAYYIPEAMEYDNKLVGYFKDKVDDDSVINSCYQGVLPKNLLTRTTKFYEENSHIQVYGFKDVEGTIIVRVYITVGGTTTEIASVADMQAKISDYITAGTSYTLSYEYDFYVKDVNTPVYNVVRICNSNALTDYIDSLIGGYIPSETIVLLTNDLSKSSSTSHILEINSSKLSTINLSKNSALIGINTNGENSNIILDFNDGTENISGVTVYSQQKMDHEFINDNKGIIAGFNVHNLAMYTISENSSVGFAPIITNSGIIDNFNLRNVSISTAVRSHVAGLVAKNNSSGQIVNCELVGISLSSRKYVNFICTNNNGYIANTVKYVSGSYNGNIYNGGV